MFGFVSSRIATENFVVFWSEVGSACPFDYNYFVISLRGLQAKAVDLPNDCNHLRETTLQGREEAGELVLEFTRSDRRKIVRRIK